MPRFDGTGPLGRGPSSGRGFGPCGFGPEWKSRFGLERGLNRHFGWFNRLQNKDDQIKSLAEYKKTLEQELEYVNKEETELCKND